MEKIIFNDENGKLVKLNVENYVDFKDCLVGFGKGMSQREIPLNPVGFISNGGYSHTILHDKEGLVR